MEKLDKHIEEFISKTAIFGNNKSLNDVLEDDTKKIIVEEGLRWRYKKGTIIFDSGDYIHNLYCILNGSVIYELSDSAGNKKIVGFTKNFLSAECYFNKQPILYSARVLEESEIYALSYGTFEKLMLSKSFRDLLLESLGEVCRVCGWQINELAFCDARSRVCRLLCCCAINDSDGGVPFVKLTHQNIAFITGVHRVTVSNILLSLVKEGKIKKSKSEYIICDWQSMVEEGFRDNILY